ncbi:MAG: hypothetical protein GWO24_11850 [Akkermansiaceae bacterium]|nr:hypothetical protein [Akkermansiaceae bacterium]
MSLDHPQQEEYVPVEAGIVADIVTGELRSLWLENHHCLLAERKSRKQASRRRRARAVGIALTMALLMLLIGIRWFSS